jgi:hypothetical protein
MATATTSFSGRSQTRRPLQPLSPNNQRTPSKQLHDGGRKLVTKKEHAASTTDLIGLVNKVRTEHTQAPERARSSPARFFVWAYLEAILGTLYFYSSVEIILYLHVLERHFQFNLCNRGFAKRDSSRPV